MQDEINSLCDRPYGLTGLKENPVLDDERFSSPVIQEMSKVAEQLKKRCWPNDEPCPCEADDGWTYARILLCFDEPDVCVFRPPHHDGWYVFPNAASLRRFMRFLLKHSWML